MLADRARVVEPALRVPARATRVGVGVHLEEHEVPEERVVRCWMGLDNLVDPRERFLGAFRGLDVGRIPRPRDEINPHERGHGRDAGLC